MADDEELARKSTCALLQKLGYCNLHTVCDGTQALAAVQALQPELVLADIRMPGLSGLELLQQCRAACAKRIPFVFISGYDLFEYAQMAIKLGAQGYLLKPFDEEELDAVLRTLVAEILAEKQCASPALPSEAERQAEVLHLLPHWFLQHAAPRDVSTAAATQEPEWEAALAAQFAAHLPANGTTLYHTVLVFFDVAHSFTPEPGQRVLLELQPALVELVQACCPEPCAVVSFVSEPVICLLLACKADAREMHRQAMPLLQQRISAVAPLKSVFTFGAFSEQLAGLADSYADCCRQLVHLLLAQEPDPESALSGLFPAPQSSLVTELQEAFRRVSATHIMQQTENAYNLFLLRGYLNFIPLPILHAEFLNVFYAAAAATGISLAGKWGDQALLLPLLAEKATLSAVLSWYRDKLHVLFSPDAVAEQNTMHKSVLLAKQYLQKNLSEQLSLEQVAQYVNVSPNYFSRCFKEETGETFGSYLLHIRIETAKQLLLDKTCTAADVGAMVGFCNTKYFYKLFKKVTGTSPGKFR